MPDQELNDLQFEETRQLLLNATEALQKNTEIMNNLPIEISKVIPDESNINILEHITLDEDSKVTIANMGVFIEHVASLKEYVTKAVSDAIKGTEKELVVPDTFKIENISEAKTDLTQLVKNYDELLKALILLAKRETIVDIPDEIEIKNWPKKPSEAIAVRLVTQNGKDFYEALAGGGVSSGGNGFTYDSEANIINPATKEKQDEIITAIQALDPSAESANYVKRFAEVGDDSYIGYAVVTGSAIDKAGAVWQIRKANDNGIFFAEGDATFDKIWNSRASYDYQDA